MAIQKTQGAIEFTYQFDDINDVVQLITAEIAVTILDEEKMPMLDEFAISDDEKYTVMQKMKDAATEIFDRFLKVTSTSVDAVAISDSAVSCKIKDRNAYNENTLKAIDRLIMSAFVNYIVADWFTDKKVGDHAQIYNLKYVKNIRDIMKRSVQLRKPTI